MPLRISTTADTTPQFFNLRVGMSESGAMDMGDIHRALYNLTRCIHGLAAQLDADGGVTDETYGSNNADNLVIAHAKMAIPAIGPVTGS